MDGGIREWLGDLSRREMVLVGLLLLAAFGGAGLWYVRSLPRPVAVEAPVAAPAPTPTSASIFVHVAGWVRNPGVYELPEGARVVDAITLAGGPRRNAELSALNLAAVLVDGQQVLVARALPPEAVATAPSAPGATAASPDAGSELINVNTATAAELEELPGIGPVLSEAIVAYREEHGPFTSVDQLEDVSGIGPATLEKLRPLVTI